MVYKLMQSGSSVFTRFLLYRLLSGKPPIRGTKHIDGCHWEENNISFMQAKWKMLMISRYFDWPDNKYSRRRNAKVRTRGNKP